MSDKHTLDIDYQIKQSRKCKKLSRQNRALFSTLEAVIIQLKQNTPYEKITEKIEKILSENKPL